MNIRFTSSLTPDDENLIAPVVLQTLASILNLLPIAYVVRIDTSDSQVYQLAGGGVGNGQAARVPDEDGVLKALHLQTELPQGARDFRPWSTSGTP